MPHIDVSELLGVMSALGFEPETQSGYYKYEIGRGHRLYISRNERCTRVDLAGPVPGVGPDGKPNPGYRILGEGERIGAVRCQLDFSQPKETVAMALAAAVVAVVQGVVPDAKPPRRGRPPLAGRKPRDERATVPVPVDRKDLIRRVAAEMNVEVSSRATFVEEEKDGSQAAG